MTSVVTFLVIYLLAAAVYYATSFWRQKIGKPPGRLEESFSMVFVPAFLLFMLLIWPLVTVYFLLYPERHMNAADLHGTAEEKARIAEFREYRKRVTLCGRIAERLGLRPYDAPPDCK